MSFTLKQLAEKTGGIVRGDDSRIISMVCGIQDGKPGAISFIASLKFAKYLQATQAEAVILSENLADLSPVSTLIVDNPRAVYARITKLLYPPFEPGVAGIHLTAVIDASANVAADAFIGAHTVIGADTHIGKNARIGAGCVLDRDCSVGDNSCLNSNVTLYRNCHLGRNCILHSGAVIGADGFGFEFDQGEWLKIQHIGGVRIGDDVEIGACSTVDRGSIMDTVIEDGVKLDNHVQIAHNVRVGAHTVMANGVGVAGSTKIGRNCIIGGMAGIRDGVEISDNVMITGMSLVSKSLLKPGSYSSNTPIDDTRTWRRNSARFRRLDELAKRVRELEREVKTSKPL